MAIYIGWIVKLSLYSLGAYLVYSGPDSTNHAVLTRFFLFLVWLGILSFLLPVFLDLSKKPVLKQKKTTMIKLATILDASWIAAVLVFLDYSITGGVWILSMILWHIATSEE